jgi:NADH-quinone oxidoreductase subunit A
VGHGWKHAAVKQHDRGRVRLHILLGDGLRHHDDPRRLHARREYRASKTRCSTDGSALLQKCSRACQESEGSNGARAGPERPAGCSLAAPATTCFLELSPAHFRKTERKNSLSCALCCAALSHKNNSNQRICGCPKPQEKVPPMNGILQNYLPLVVFIGVASLIGVALLIAPFLVAFQQPDPEKLSAYECGFNAFDDARMKFDVRFYLVAILFIIFDLEVAFLFPWAVAFGKLGATGFWSMMVFLGVLTVGFAYEWKKGALEWD